MTRGTTGLRAALATLLLVACSNASDDAPRSLAQAVIGGTESSATHDQIVLLVHSDGAKVFATCSGTLVAPNVVMTARHCVSAVAKGG